MTEEELLRLTEAAFRGLGIRARDAQDTARILVLGDLFGHATHGVSRAESYGERLEIGGINRAPLIQVHDAAPAIALVDGDNGLGPVVGTRALEEAKARARHLGVGVALARASNHFGAIAPYCWLAAQEGFASIIGSNSTATIAPTGGSQARLGNSPLGFGIPGGEGPPIILDMALSVVARARIRAALSRGESIPDTWATDRAGNPTTDPRAALEGFLLPIGGYKGYGLALVVDLLAGVLSGASYLTRVTSWSDEPGKGQDLGHFFILIDASRLGTRQWLHERMSDFARILHETPAADATRPVRLPGENELANLERQRREGIAIDPKVLELLRGYAARTGSA